MKPHLRPSRSGWICSGDGVEVWEPTEAQAFDSWHGRRFERDLRLMTWAEDKVDELIRRATPARWPQP